MYECITALDLNGRLRRIDMKESYISSSKKSKNLSLKQLSTKGVGTNIAKYWSNILLCQAWICTNIRGQKNLKKLRVKNNYQLIIQQLL